MVNAPARDRRTSKRSSGWWGRDARRWRISGRWELMVCSNQKLGMSAAPNPANPADLSRRSLPNPVLLPMRMESMRLTNPTRCSFAEKSRRGGMNEGSRAMPPLTSRRIRATGRTFIPSRDSPSTRILRFFLATSTGRSATPVFSSRR